MSLPETPLLPPIEFWFDFSSGYAYFAALEIDDLAARHARAVRWRPFLLGVAFQATGSRGLSGTPLKGDYARRDWARLSRLKGVSFAIPAVHPFSAVAASRAYYWMEEHQPDTAHAFAVDVFRGHFVEGVDMTDVDRLADLAGRHGAEVAEVREAVRGPELKRRLRTTCDEALAKGIFGSPFFLADGEPFWGWDRMPMLEDWLARSGW